MGHDGVTQGYGLWGMVLFHSMIFLAFAFSFFKPQTRRDWRTFGSFSAFIVALFVEMYGFPLTIYLLSGWLQSYFPGANLLGHDAGHLWHSLLGLEGNPHLHPIHLLSNALIIAGFFLLSASWRVLFDAQRTGQLATTGTYRHVRHPQYVAFIVIMLGFLAQWPTLLTLLMFPILVVVYVRLALREEREVAADFREQWQAYAAVTPRWIPQLRQRPRNPQGTPTGVRP